MKNEFIERMIFEKEKETSFNNSYDFCKKIRDKYKIDYYLGDLYKRIVNYQIDKYGASLQYVVETHNTEELIKLGRNASKRRYGRRSKRTRS